MPLLIVTTLVCICATLLLGNGGLLISLCLFALALTAMELGTIFYNALLTEVSTPTTRGRVSGLGQGIGYLGVFIAVGAALLLSEPKGYVFVFRVVALMFLLFSLPIFFLLKERPREVLTSTGLGKVSRAFSQLSGNLRSLHQFPGLRQFLLARFLYGTGVNTAVAFAVVYASETIGLSDREIYLILIVGTSVAVPSGVFLGTIVDRVGPQNCADLRPSDVDRVAPVRRSNPVAILASTPVLGCGMPHGIGDGRNLDGGPPLYAQLYTAPIPWGVLWATRYGRQIRPGHRPLYVGPYSGHPRSGPARGLAKSGRLSGGLVCSANEDQGAGKVPFGRSGRIK